MNIANLITLFRIILIPVFLLVFHSNIDNSILYAGLIFLLSGISDGLDGYIARKYDMITKLGAILDPFADKLMSFAVLISFAIGGFIPYWIIILILSKEAIMILGGAILYFRKEHIVIPANIVGKAATVALYASILSIAFKFPVNISAILLIITLVLNIIAFINYINIYREIKKPSKVEQ